MKSYELQAELDSYLGKLDSKIAEYNTLLQSTKTIINSMQSFDGINTKFYSGITSNINNVSTSICNSISTLNSLKSTVRGSVVPRIRELKRQEDEAAKKLKESQESEE